MIVRFTKARHAERPHTFTCVRDDGSTTGQASSSFFVRHDLTHFAVESVLGQRRAFFGLLASGWNVEAFEEREPGSRKSRKLPDEALVAEFTVGALDLDLTGGMPAEEVSAYVREQLAANGFDIVGPTASQVEDVRARRQELMIAWSNLEPGETLELRWTGSAIGAV